MAQQTALEQFIDWINSDCTFMDCVMKAEELLKVEKQQQQDIAIEFAKWIDNNKDYIPFDLEQWSYELLYKEYYLKQK